MKQQVFFIHGAEAFSAYDAFVNSLKTRPIRDPLAPRVRLRWCDHLRKQLGDEFEVFTPSMPNKENAQYNEWKIWFERYFEYIHDDIVLVGWSQGGYFLAKYLTENEFPVRIKSLYLVAAPFEPDDFGEEDGGDFSYDTDALVRLSDQCGHVVILHSKDDFVVPYEHALKYKKALPKAELVTFDDRNHFLQEEFPELIEKIKEIVGE